MKTEQWHGCYDQQWADLIVPEAMSHPAKMSRGLLERIIRHGFERGWWEKNAVIGDPFGGIGSTGLLGAYHGLKVISVELEKRFVSLARRNYARHTRKWRVLGVPRPVMLQGDSRFFDEIVGESAGIVTSPPYADIATGQGGLNTKPAKHPGQQSGRTASLASQNADQRYGQTPGQIGRLKSGTLVACLSSPPYAEGCAHTGGKDSKPECVEGGAIHHVHYGQSSGQIGRLKSGALEGVVSSPPFEKCDQRKPGIKPEAVRPDGKACGMGASMTGYPESEGQIGQEKGETYWQAVRDVYAACFRAIRPGGVMVLVTKDYVSKRRRVPLSDDTVKLCESIGFTLIERIQAMLVSEMRHGDLFNGEDVKTKSRKSFFRRLAESKGSPEINYEDVMCFQRP